MKLSELQVFDTPSDTSRKIVGPTHLYKYALTLQGGLHAHGIDCFNFNGLCFILNSNHFIIYLFIYK